jgi:hypothetical protein
MIISAKTLVKYMKVFHSNIRGIKFPLFHLIKIKYKKKSYEKVKKCKNDETQFSGN